MKSWFAIAVILLTTSCSSVFSPIGSNKAITGSDKETVPAYFAQFPDVPFPEKTSMDLDGTVVLGSNESWFGKLAFSAPYNVSAMFDFYASEMPKFGWQEVTAIRSKISSLTYSRSSRIAAIQLEQTGSNSTSVTLTVTPSAQNNVSTIPSSSSRQVTKENIE